MTMRMRVTVLGLMLASFALAEGKFRGSFDYQQELFRTRDYTVAEPVGMQLDLKIWTTGISEASRKVDEVLKESGARIESLRLDSVEKTLDARFLVPDGQIDAVRSRLGAVGTVYMNDLTVQGDSSKARTAIRQLRQELEFKRVQQSLHSLELAKLDRAQEPEAWESLWNATRRLEVDTFQISRQIVEREGDMRRNLVKLRVSEPRSSDIEESMFRFVNMPGGEYLRFTPGTGGPRIAESYQGPAFRYLFTRGKSYLTVGVLESDPAVASSDSSRISEILLVSLGTDFYPRHFGQGRRTWFNLYSGAQLGAMLLSDASTSRLVWMAAPHAGMEIWKGARGLVDLKAAYYLPLSETWNRNLRGWSFSAGANVAL